MRTAALVLLAAAFIAGCAAPSIPVSARPSPGGDVVATQIKPAERVAREVTKREWQLIARDPESYVLDRVIVYGRVFQFDATTGTASFLADMEGEPDPEGRYFDGVITICQGDAEMFANLVEDDNIKADVTIAGSLEYETRIGGTNTAVLVAVNSVTLYTGT